MYALARGPQAAALASRADGEDLGKDRERRLARRRRPEVEPGGAAQPLELGRRAASPAQALAPPPPLPPPARAPPPFVESQRSPARSPSTTVNATCAASGSGSSSSTRSTKTSISPPHGSPTSHASSSAIPYETSLGRPLAKTSVAWVATSLSTHPPETDPASSPLSETASFDPSGRGADRRVATTVASATAFPSARQRSIASSTSRTRLSLAASPRAPSSAAGRRSRRAAAGRRRRGRTTRA